MWDVAPNSAASARCLVQRSSLRLKCPLQRRDTRSSRLRSGRTGRWLSSRTWNQQKIQSFPDTSGKGYPRFLAGPVPSPRRAAFMASRVLGFGTNGSNGSAFSAAMRPAALLLCRRARSIRLANHSPAVRTSAPGPVGATGAGGPRRRGVIIGRRRRRVRLVGDGRPVWPCASGAIHPVRAGDRARRRDERQHASRAKDSRREVPHLTAPFRGRAATLRGESVRFKHGSPRGEHRV